MHRVRCCFTLWKRRASGGETVLVDGFAVAETLRREAPRSFNLLCQLQWRHAFASPDMDIRAEASVIGLTADGTYDRIVFNRYTAAPVNFAADIVEEAYRAWQHYAAISQRHTMQYRFRMPSGNALFFDNRRVLHARTAFDAQSGRRRLRSCYLERDAFHSNIRLLAKRLDDPLAEVVFTSG